MALTAAEFARYISKVGRLVSGAQSDLAEGMWNPNFCSRECGAWEMSICVEVLDKVNHIIKRLEE